MTMNEAASLCTGTKMVCSNRRRSSAIADTRGQMALLDRTLADQWRTTVIVSWKV
jgi:hypothetical protein